MDKILNRILRLMEDSGHFFILYIVLLLASMTLYIALLFFMQ